MKQSSVLLTSTIAFVAIVLTGCMTEDAGDEFDDVEVEEQIDASPTPIDPSELAGKKKNKIDQLCYELYKAHTEICALGLQHGGGVPAYEECMDQARADWDSCKSD